MPEQTTPKNQKNKSVSVPFATWDLIARVAMKAAPQIERRLALHEVITAALYVAHTHNEEMLAALSDPQCLQKLTDTLVLRPKG